MKTDRFQSRSRLAGQNARLPSGNRSVYSAENRSVSGVLRHRVLIESVLNFLEP